MYYVFIDTNVFLNFYTFNKDHLEKLENLIDLIKSKKIKLILTRQIVNEVNRNRENKLKETLTSLKSFQMKLAIPSTCHGMSEMNEIQKTIESLKELSKKFEVKLLDQIKKKTLLADKLIHSIFTMNEIIEVSEELLMGAKRRFELGNPPGKKGSLGDAINWESISNNVPEKSDLYFIGGDRDYISDINENEFSGFLREEWESEKKSKLFYYGLISQFLRDQFPKVKITQKDIGEERKAVNESEASRVLGVSTPSKWWHAMLGNVKVDWEEFHHSRLYGDTIDWRMIPGILDSHIHGTQITPNEIMENYPEKTSENSQDSEGKDK